MAAKDPLAAASFLPKPFTPGSRFFITKRAPGMPVR